MRVCASRPAHRSRQQAGYGLLFVIFLSATMLLLAFAAAPSIINQGRREREQQLIWRGNQYVRGIRLYFQKNGRFPQNKEELLKGTLQVHFVRKAFTDPVKTPNSDWRMIYVAPSGQLIGSVRYHTLQEMAAELGGSAQPPGSGSLASLFGGPAGAQAGAGDAPAGRPQGGAPAAGGRGGPADLAAQKATAAAAAGAAAPGQTPAGTQPATGFGQPTPVPLEAVDGPVFGASMIGIASKVKQTSLLVYQGKDSYFEWEFIWNPLLNRGPGGAPSPQQAIQGGAPGTAMPPVGAPTGQQAAPAPGQPAGPTGTPMSP